MFNEHEITSFLEDPQIFDAVVENRRNFLLQEAKFLEINEHDFLSLIMMAPSVGIAKSNGAVSLFEELALNKMARKMSKGGYFLKQDPVAHAMKYLIKNYEQWEQPFFDVIKLCMVKSFDVQKVQDVELEAEGEKPVITFSQHLMRIPYGFVRFLTSFFLQDENDLIQERQVSQVEYTKILDLAEKLEINEVPAFKSFLKTFIIK